jgi:uncharacterized protein
MDRFLLDEMLARLARLMRAAGYDAALAASGAPDDDLLAQAQAEDRTVLTRDRELAARAGDRGILIAHDGIDEQARALKALVGIDWLLAPFTRCVMDNSTLRPATEAEREAMPKTVRDLPGEFNACPRCGRLYWPGGHVKRMRERLSGLNAA